MPKIKPKGRLFIVVGVLLIISAIALTGWNIYTDTKGGRASAEVLEKLEAQIPEIKSDEGFVTDLPELPDDSPKRESFIEIDGIRYIGIVSVPEINVKLPVISEWDDADSEIAPCRYYGTVAQKNLIIAAHNYSSFFVRLDELNSGDKIYFKDCDGVVTAYEVVSTELVGGYEAEKMKGDDENWDLTLFTCTWSGTSRVTVRAVEV